MEVKVEVGLSKGLESIMNRFINALEGVGTSGNVHKASHPRPIDSEEKAAGQETVELKVESVSDVEMAAPAEEDSNDSIDYPLLRKEIKKFGVKLVQAKKQSEVKALTAKYGYSKMDDLPDNKLEAYFKDLKEIQSG